MRYLLSRACQPILKRLAQERALCAFDFDGTLSPIAEHPDRATLPNHTLLLLSRLTELYPCIIVSGRGRADLLGKLNGVKVTGAFGNHGAETEGAKQKWHHRAQEWKTELNLEIGAMPGVWVEDKGLSLAVHYRQSAEKAEARRRILAVTRNLRQTRVFGGKQVINIVMETAPHKGDAVASERDRLGCTWVLYVGDDENDEDAFALDGNLVGVRVGRKRSSRASYYLRTQKEIDKLLEVLVRLRETRAKE